MALCDIKLHIKTQHSPLRISFNFSWVTYNVFIKVRKTVPRVSKIEVFVLEFLKIVGAEQFNTRLRWCSLCPHYLKATFFINTETSRDMTHAN